MEEIWDRATPVSAGDQRPLWNAQLEGERTLHWLETLPPDSAWHQLLLAGVGAAAAILSRCQGAALPAAADCLSRYMFIYCMLGSDCES